MVVEMLADFDFPYWVIIYLSMDDCSVQITCSWVNQGLRIDIKSTL